jgi:hypothetical protein
MGYGNKLKKRIIHHNSLTPTGFSPPLVCQSVAMNSKRLLLISTAETKLKIQTPIFDSIDGKYRKAGNQKEKTAKKQNQRFPSREKSFPNYEQDRTPFGEAEYCEKIPGRLSGSKRSKVAGRSILSTDFKKRLSSCSGCNIQFCLRKSVQRLRNMWKILMFTSRQ